MKEVKQNKKFTKGFTLLELLVVVLIIGVLAAIALPQYKRAVEKSKSAEALTILKAVSGSIQRYYLTNSSFPSDFKDLDIGIPMTGNVKFMPNAWDKTALSNEDWSLSFENNAGYTTLIIGRIKGKYAGAGFSAAYYASGNNKPGSIHCFERLSSANYLFDTNLPEGSYCEGIMGWKFKSSSIYSRSYFP